MNSLIVFFLLFLLPFIIAPFGITEFENPKVIFAEIGIIILFLISLFTKNKGNFEKRTYGVIYIGFFAVTIIDLLFFRTSLSFLGNVFRTQGIFLFWLLLLFSFLSSKITLKKIPWWVFLCLLLIEGIALFFLPQNDSLRSVGTLGEPNALAAFVIFLWPFLFFSIAKFDTWKKFVVVLGLGITLGIIFFSGSRSGLIAFSIQLLFIVLQKVKITTKIATIICICFFAFSLLFPFFEKDVLYENRLEVWQAALYAGMKSPIIGSGFGNTELLLHKAAVDHGLRIRFYYVDSSHNIFLDFFVQAGIVGVSLFVWLLFLTFKQFTLSGRKRELILLLGSLTTLSFNPASVVGLLGFWWLIGQSQSDIKHMPNTAEN